MNDNKKSVVDILFLMSLFFLLTVTGIFTIVFGAKVYEKTQVIMEQNYEIRTADMYLKNKILAHDYDGGVLVSEDMLVLSSSSGDYKTKTYLYYKDGYLQEMTASESFQFDYQNGSMIMPMETFNIEKINDNLLKVNIVSKGIDTEFYITVMSGIL